jgi:PKD repeat protein
MTPIMKSIYKLGFIGVLAFAAVSCVENDPEYAQFADPDVDFTYNVEGDQYVTDYYVVSTIEFNNVSSKAGTCTWNFGDGTEIQSNDKVVSHKYKEAGNYDVTLTIAGVGSRTYPLMISDIVPKLSIDSVSNNDELIELNKTAISFNLALPNPENLKVKYEWYFPEGTSYEDGSAVPDNMFVGYADETGKVDYPAQMVKFKNIGSQQVLIRTYFDTEGENRRLADTYLNVQVASSVEAPTLYYACKKGNIKAMKLIDQSLLPEGTQILPYDMGASAGEMPANILYGEYDATDEEGNTVKQQCIYILDRGKQYIYVNDTGSVLGDGKITAMNVDGTNVNTVVSNVGKAAFMDPYFGFIQGRELYYSDRHYGVSKIDISSRGQSETQNTGDAQYRGSYVWQNNFLPYYGRGMAWGAFPRGLQKDSNGVWWYGVDNAGKGIFRFTDSDIKKSQSEAESSPLPDYPILVSTTSLNAFAVDDVNNALYVWGNDGTTNGFFHYDMANNGALVKSVAMSANPENSSVVEKICTSQFAVDSDGKRVFFAFRPESGVETNYKAGIYYYDLNDNTIKTYGISTDEAFGICINPNPSKLF